MGKCVLLFSVFLINFSGSFFPVVKCNGKVQGGCEAAGCRMQTDGWKSQWDLFADFLYISRNFALKSMYSHMCVPCA
jgi:hypothetical protein